MKPWALKCCNSSYVCPDTQLFQDLLNQFLFSMKVTALGSHQTVAHQGQGEKQALFRSTSITPSNPSSVKEGRHFDRTQKATILKLGLVVSSSVLQNK